MALPTNLLIGPSGWTSAQWTGLVQPKTVNRKVAGLDAVLRYASLAEIDQTFLGPIKPELGSLYANRANAQPGFQFTVPLWRRFTHARDLNPAAVQDWKQGVYPILRARALGAVILRFPWSFRFTQENRDWLIQLRRSFHEFPLAAEFRHESWMREEAQGTLIDYHVAMVNLDQPEYFRGVAPAAMLTTSLAVVRLDGRRGAEWFQAFEPDQPKPQYLYASEELESWLPRLHRLSHSAAKTLVIFSNTGGAHSMVNALQLGEMMGESRRVAPPQLILNYPGELAAFRSPKPVQPLLVGMAEARRASAA